MRTPPALPERSPRCAASARLLPAARARRCCSPAPALAGGPTAARGRGRGGLRQGHARGPLAQQRRRAAARAGVRRPRRSRPRRAWSATRSGDALWIGCGNDASLRRVGADGKVESVERGRRPDGHGARAAARAAPWPRRCSRAGAVVRVAAAQGRAARASWPRSTSGRCSPTRTARLTWPPRACRGRCGRVDTSGAVTKVCDVDDDHARCLAGTADDLLVGTGGKGRVLAREGRQAERAARPRRRTRSWASCGSPTARCVVAANTDAGGGNVQQLANLAEADRAARRRRAASRRSPRSAPRCRTARCCTSRPRAP